MSDQHIRDDIVELLADHGEMTAAELVELSTTAFDAKQVSNAIYRLKKEGVVEKAGTDGRKFLYRLAVKADVDGQQFLYPQAPKAEGRASGDEAHELESDDQPDRGGTSEPKRAEPCAEERPIHQTILPPIVAAQDCLAEQLAELDDVLTATLPAGSTQQRLFALSIHTRNRLLAMMRAG